MLKSFGAISHIFSHKHISHTVDTLKILLRISLVEMAVMLKSSMILRYSERQLYLKINLDESISIFMEQKVYMIITYL
jgi:hypothetical protein